MTLLSALNKISLTDEFSIINTVIFPFTTVKLCSIKRLDLNKNVLLLWWVKYVLMQKISIWIFGRNPFWDSDTRANGCTSSSCSSRHTLNNTIPSSLLEHAVMVTVFRRGQGRCSSLSGQQEDTRTVQSFTTRPFGKNIWRQWAVTAERERERES